MLGPTPPHHIGVLTHKMLPGDHHDDDDVDDYDYGYMFLYDDPDADDDTK